MKIGYTVWEWMRYFPDGVESIPLEGDPKKQFEDALRDIADLGYQTVENFHYMLDYYKDADDELEAVLKKYNMEFICLYHYMTEDFDSDLKKTEECIAFCKRHGIKLINLQAPFTREGQKETDWEFLKEVCRRANIIGKMTKDNGIDICVHPHFGTVVYYENEVDYFAENTDPSYVSFCIDTAHSTIAGIDPVKLTEKYISRTKYFHFKDVFTNPGSEDDLLVFRFAALGQGTVDFRGVYDVMKKNNYDGCICVECDYPLVNNYQSAMISRNYLHSVLGL